MCILLLSSPKHFWSFTEFLPIVLFFRSSSNSLKEKTRDFLRENGSCSWKQKVCRAVWRMKKKRYFYYVLPQTVWDQSVAFMVWYLVFRRKGANFIRSHSFFYSQSPRFKSFRTLLQAGPASTITRWKGRKENLTNWRNDWISCWLTKRRRNRVKSSLHHSLHQ